MAISLARDFKEFLSLLNSNDVEYLVVGGYAVSIHGYPRATGDLDIWVRKASENASRLADVIRAFGFGFTDPEPSWFLENNRIIRMGHPPVRIEILTDISGVEFETCYSKRRIEVIDGVSINCISLEHLRQNKQASGRHKDLADLENLEE